MGKKKNWKIQFFVMSFCVLGLVAITAGSSYAIFSDVSSQEDYNTVTTGTLQLAYEDNQSLSLNNSFPVSDEVGMKGTGYTFTVRNVGTLPSDYKVMIQDDTAMIEADGCSDYLMPKVNIKVSVNGGDPFLLSSIEESNYMITTGNLQPGESVTHVVKIWIDEASGNEILGTHFHAKVVVEGVQGEFVYRDESGANAPKLVEGMIPVIYDEAQASWVKADTTNKWYDYNNQEWANAVTVQQNVIYDASLHQNYGDPYGIVYDALEKAYVFDGKDDYVDLGLENYDFSNGQTIVIRFKMNEIIPGIINRVVGNWESGGGGFSYDPTVDQLLYESYNLTTDSYERVALPKNVIQKGQYYIMVGIYDKENQKLKIYVNGKFIAESSSIGDRKNSTLPFLIGANPNGNGPVEFSNITVSDVLIYDKALDDDQVQQQFGDRIQVNNKDGLITWAKVQKGKDFENGTAIDLDYINTMWVWIPRYEYMYTNLGDQYAGGTEEQPGEIKVNFLNGTSTTPSDAANYKVHPAFTFGDEELTGLWYGKFEMSILESCIAADGDVNKGCDLTTFTLQIKPSVESWLGARVSTFFESIRGMQTNKYVTYGFANNESYDIHMSKNSEWGAVAYLSQSRYGKYGNSNYEGENKEVAINNCIEYITGIYDMSGGSYEYVMGVLADENGNPRGGASSSYNSGFNGSLNSGSYNSGIDFPEAKYYDLYTTSNVNTACSEGICYGHALSEILRWYGDNPFFIDSAFPWFARGGHLSEGVQAGVFLFTAWEGGTSIAGSSRAVLVPEV